jgi:enoyl-[acyl-carrier protein] reductase I
MKGKRGLILGVANEASIAWAIAKTLTQEGASLAFTYPNTPIQTRVTALCENLPKPCPVLWCDVSVEDSVQGVFDVLKQEWGSLDFVLHSIAFSDKNQLTGHYANTTRENFLNTMNISCYSFTEVCREGQKLMPQGGAFLALTYLGANRVIPHYNVMGVAKAALEASVRYLADDLGPQNIRVNALSSGSLRTAASSGIGDFHYIMNWNKNNSPLRRNVTAEEVGKSGLYLLSPLSSAVTGEVHYVDCGYHVVGMKAVDAQDIESNKDK